MRYVLVLPGNSVKNRAWGVACREYVQEMFDSVYVLQYTHWETGEPEIDLEEELEKIRTVVTEADGDVVWHIFAKSIGSVLALKAVEQGVIKPERCVFFGMSLEIAKAKFGEDWSYLSRYDLPALAFHNDADPVADYAYTKSKIAEYAPSVTFKTLQGDTHDYLDFSEYELEITRFLQL